MSATEPVTSTSVSSSGADNYSGSGPMTFPQAENIWIQAGGNAQAANMAAAIASASSGLDPTISRTNPDGTTSIGLWLIPSNGTPPGSTDPLANARAAIQLSNNGTDWSQWCVAWSDNNCGINGGTYLGQGSDALGALGDTGAYNVIGASPAGDGTSAGTATGTTTPTTSGWHNYIIIAVVIAMILVVFLMTRRKTGESGSGTGAEGSAWSPEETAALSSSESDTELAKRLGRSRHAIHVKRSRLGADSDYTH